MEQRSHPAASESEVMLRTFAQLFVIATFTLLSCSETRREEHAGRVMQNDGVAALGDMLIECGFIKLPFYNHYHDSWAPRLVAVGQIGRAHV
jgi:hypothetical protein